ncbi:hypothetical protein Ahu01nite_073190 [Winogradskya humida]|uniref:DNA-binding MarR family transcriptional regulator n=1 Tax=Winogradskya humida TaxID=113566 RepID=A0ABQ4A1I6_9ACTN|nr:hypothetical protein Ahu01nite_073190 [Actinoplanes humidus]
MVSLPARCRSTPMASAIREIGRPAGESPRASRNRDLINDQFARTLGRRDVTRRQWQLLSILHSGPVTLAAANEALAPFGEDVLPHLDSLATRGIAARDGEACTHHRCRPGAGRCPVAEVREMRELTTAGLREGDYEHAIATLRAMIRNLGNGSSG